MPDDEPDEPPGLDLGRWEAIGTVPPNTPLVGVVDTNRNRQLEKMADRDDFEVLSVPDIAKDEIKTVQRKVRRGNTDVDPLDGHRLLVQLKISAALMILEGRRHTITESDWIRARLIMAVSDITRRSVLDDIAKEQETKNVSRARAEGKRKIVIEQVIDQEAVRIESMAERIPEALEVEDGQTVSALGRKLSSNKNRDVFERAVLLLVKNGTVKRDDFITPNKQESTRLWLL